MSPDQPNRHRGATFTVNELRIERLDGIAHPFDLGPFIPGVNLVIGPNASGKSRTSEAIQALIWPASSQLGASLGGSVTIDDTVWAVKADGTRAAYLRDGSPADGPDLNGTPGSTRGRYLLTLHDLLRADNQDLAEHIQRESAGGYDLRQARDHARFPKKVEKPGGRQQVKLFREARDKTRAIRRDYEDLATQERDLATLLDQIAESRRAGEFVQKVDEAIEHAEILDRIRALDTRKASFPAPIARMSGNEPDTLERLRREIGKLEEERLDLERKIAAGILERNAAGFEDAIPTSALVSELRTRAAELTALRNELDNSAAAIDDLQGQISRATARIGDQLSETQLNQLDTGGMRRLADHLLATIRVQSQLDAKEELQRWLKDSGDAGRLENLLSGVEHLYRRLRLIGHESDSQVPGQIKLALVLASIAIIVLSGMLATTNNLAFSAFALLALPVLYLALKERPNIEAERAKSIEHEYSLLPLPQPSSWNEEQIERLLTELRVHLAAAELAREKATRWEGLDVRIGEIATQLSKLQLERTMLEEELGMTSVPSDWEAIRILAETLDQWRSAREHHLRSLDVHAHKSRQFSELLDSINAIFAQVGCSPSSDIARVIVTIEEVSGRIDRASRAAESIARCEESVSGRVRESIERLEEDIADLYSTIGLETGDQDGLELCIERLPAWKHLCEELLTSTTRRDQIQARLGDHADLLVMGRDDLENLRAEKSALFGMMEDRLRRHTEITGSVEEARRSHHLEDALDTELDARADLADARTRSIESAANWSVWNFVAERTRDFNRPPVYKIADELFTSFTAGAFTLQFGDTTTPAFQARDTSTGRVLDLDQLSSGTRLQLLMAVRIAFIEQSEPGYRLPLILDETFANTDDLRMSAIMDATIEICRSGRQIFYFTAQQDEISRWIDRLDRDDVGVQYTLTDLAERRGASAYVRPAHPAVAVDIFQKPAPPENLDHEGAHAFLNVAPINPWAENLDHAALWYFVTDVPLLCTAAEFGFGHWGAFATAGQSVLRKLAPHFDSTLELAQLRHRTIDLTLRHWRIGRCAPCSLEDIRESGAFTPGTINAIASVAAAAGWNGAETIARLRANRPDRVTIARITQFEDWLQSNDRITQAAQLSPELIRGNVIAAMHELLSIDEIDHTLQSVKLLDQLTAV